MLQFRIQERCLKEFDFLLSTVLKLLSQVPANNINNCDFLLIIFVRDNHWDYLLYTPKQNVTTPVLRRCIFFQWRTTLIAQYSMLLCHSIPRLHLSVFICPVLRLRPAGRLSCSNWTLYNWREIRERRAGIWEGTVIGRHFGIKESFATEERPYKGNLSVR